MNTGVGIKARAHLVRAVGGVVDDRHAIRKSRSQLFDHRVDGAVFGQDQVHAFRAANAVRWILGGNRASFDEWRELLASAVPNANGLSLGEEILDHAGAE